jgi:hypothetical protein
MYYDEEILQAFEKDNEGHLYRDQFDFLDYAVAEHATQEKIIGFDHSNLNTFTIALSSRLTELFRKAGVSEFYIVSYFKVDLFGERKNKAAPLAHAHAILEKMVEAITYDEALKADMSSLPMFVDILFWMSRCDPSVGEFISLFDGNEKFHLNICKYGNIHLTQMGNEHFTDQELTDCGWTIIDGAESDCFDTND